MGGGLIKVTMTEGQQQLTAEFLANRHALFAYIYGHIRNTHDTEDLFQEVWLRFSEAVNRSVEIQNPAAWARGIARNLILHYWRDRRRDETLPDEELLNLVDLAFAEQERNRDYWLARQQALMECVEELPEKSRELLRLKYVQGLSAQGVAETLKQTAAGVWMSLSRLRQILRDCAEKKLRAEGSTP